MSQRAIIKLSNLNNFGLLIHELKHMYDFEMGDLSFAILSGTSPIYDVEDEKNAYGRADLLYQARPWSEVENESVYKNLPKGPLGIFNMIPTSVKYFPEMYIQRASNVYKAVFRFHGKTYIPKK